jgi:hypothetical protein
VWKTLGFGVFIRLLELLEVGGHLEFVKHAYDENVTSWALGKGICRSIDVFQIESLPKFVSKN